MLSEDVERVVDLAGADPEPLLAEMTAHGRERDFPIVGPAVGRLLRTLARLADAERVFEFGSGFGYSAAWFAGALPDDGELVLTDYDEANLAEAREFLREGGYDDLVRYETGDALDTFRATDGDFDVVLVDLEKHRYVEAFDLARDRVREGGLLVADNMLAGPMTPADVRAALEGEATGDHASGIARYIERVRDDDGFETSIVPLGEGIAVSRRV
jgi:predicted O-methyltransferase YrrM